MLGPKGSDDLKPNCIDRKFARSLDQSILPVDIRQPTGCRAVFCLAMLALTRALAYAGLNAKAGKNADLVDE